MVMPCYVAQDVIAIDPGYKQSAVVMCHGKSIAYRDIMPNVDLLKWLSSRWESYPLIIEQIESYGMAVGREVFETVHWSGRFHQQWAVCGRFVDLLPRKQIKLHLCQNVRAKDSNIRQALIDRFGPGKDKAIGKKAQPGPLYGFKSDLWAALAVAVTWMDQHCEQEETE